MRRIPIYFVVFLLLVLVSIPIQPSWAGWIIKMKNQDREEVHRNVIYLQNNIIKIEEEQQSIIFYAETREVCFINVPGKTYWKGSINDFKKQISGLQKEMMAGYSQQMEESMKDLPPEQQAMMKEAMKRMKQSGYNMPGMSSKQAPDVRVKKTGEAATIAGYQTRKYSVWVDKTLKEEVWLAENLIEEKDFDFELFRDFSENIMPASQETSYENSDVYREFEKKGFPLKTIVYSNGYHEVNIAEEVVEKKLAVQIFEPPIHFREQGIQEVLNQN